MYRKGIYALITNTNNEILLVNLTSFDEKYYALPGGGIEEGEDATETVYRELKEELGIDRSLIQIESKAKEPITYEFKTGPKTINRVEYVGQKKQLFLVRFLGKDSNIQIAEDEIRKYLWSSYSDLSLYLLFDNQLKDTQAKIQELAPELVSDT